MATPIEEVVHQLPGQIPEGCSVIEEGQAKVLKRGNEVFYNPVQEFNRDLSIMSIKLFIQMLREEEVQKAEKRKLKDPNAVVQHRPIRILEALSATGLRSIRYFKEIPGLVNITANDIDPNAVKTIERNILFNGLNTQQITPNCGDASMVMYQAKDPKQRYTIVDLDPYGSPADFLDSAVQAVEDGGLLAVTCTDLGVLCGNHGETCFAKYGTMPIKGARYCHEQALRIALANIQQHASRHKRYIVPLVSIYVDFYVRMFVRVYTSPQEVKHAGAKVSHVYQCTQCDSYHLAPLAKITGDEAHLKFAPGSGPPVNMTCAECNSVFKIGGPVWSEPMHSTDFLSRALQHLATDESKQMYKTHKRIFGLLSVASEELPDVPFFYVVSSLANTLRLSCPPIMPLRSALVNAGYRVSLSHCEPNSLKTNAPPSFIWDMMRAWNLKQEQQVNLDKLSDTSPAKLILSKAPTATVDFTPNKEAESKSQNLPRYLPNPTKDWGPGVRAGGKRDFDTMSMQEIIDKRRTASQEKQNKKRKLMEQGICVKFQKIMPHSMDASIILQTELLCVPTQWLVVDLTSDHRVKDWISPLDRTNAIDYLTFQHEKLHSNTPKEVKKVYKTLRPAFLEQFGTLYDKSIKDGTRGRLAVWFIGDLDDEWSAAVLNELPLDLANYCYWKQKYLPVVVRVGIGSRAASNTFLRQLSAQYFDMPAFDVKYETKPDQVLGVFSNPYDTCCVVSTDQPVIELFSKLIPLHLAETQFAKRYRNDTLGSGGQLYVVEETLVSSVSHFRRIDWLVLAQVEYCPRLWQLDKQNIFDEFLHLLDYRHWKGRFKQLSDNDTDYSKIIDLSRTSAEDTMIRRRKREKNWDSVLTDDKKRHVPYDATLLEDNVFRITNTDMNAFKELILCLQRQTRWSESLKWLDLIQKRKKYPHVFIKLKGVSLLKSGDEVEGRKWLAKYRSAILSEYEDSVLLGSPMSVADQAATYSEVAAVALVEGDSNVALEYAVKALSLNKKLVQAYKTLTWASCESGKGDWSSEELVFSFFVSYLKNPSMGEQYYTKVTENFPNNPHYRYYYAIFLSLVLNDRERAEEMFQESLQSFGDHPRVLESYATFLFQKGHSDSAEIEQLYRKALKADPDNLIITANMAAFLLANDPKKNMEEGLTMVDRVLFSSGILEREPDLALECWFYALIYKPLDRYYESLKGVKLAYRTGARAHGWDFSMHFTYAEKIKHPDLHWIKILADVITNQCTIERLQGWSAWWTAKTDRMFDAKNTAVTRPPPTSASTAPSAPTTTTVNKKKVFPTAYSRQTKQASAAAKPAASVVNDENRRENMKASSGTDASDDGTSTPPLSPTTKQLTQTIARRSSNNNSNNSMRTPPGSPLAFRLPSPVAKKGSAERSVTRSKSSLDFTVDQLANADTAGLKLSASKEISAFDFSPQVGKDSKKRKLSESREDDKTALKDSQTRASKVAKYSKDQSPSESPRSASSMDSPMKLDLSAMDSPTSPLSPRRSPRTRKTNARDPSPFDFPDDHPPVARKLPLSPGKPVAPSGTKVKRTNVKLDLVSESESVHSKVDLTADGTTSPVSGGFKPTLPSSPPRAGKVYSRRK